MAHHLEIGKRDAQAFECRNGNERHTNNPASGCNINAPADRAGIAPHGLHRFPRNHSECRPRINCHFQRNLLAAASQPRMAKNHGQVRIERENAHALECGGITFGERVVGKLDQGAAWRGAALQPLVNRGTIGAVGDQAAGQRCAAIPVHARNCDQQPLVWMPPLHNRD